MADEVGLEVTGGVGIVTIDRARTRNAIGLATISQLELVLAKVARQDVSVVVLTGAGDRAFVSGGDLKELQAIRTTEEAKGMAQRMRMVLDRLIGLPVPVIAALNGHAFGGGAEVAVGADIRVAAEDIRIGFTQSLLGIMPAWGGAERLTELVGRSQALLLMCSGRTLTAPQAAAIGLIDEVFTRDHFDKGWRDLANRFASLPPTATRSIKSVVAAVRPGTHPATEAGAVDAFAELWAAPEHWKLAAAADLNRRGEQGRKLEE